MYQLDNTFNVDILRSKCEGARSRIYGFVLYTRRDAYVIKVLKDTEFWNSLDEQSGPNWPIFYINPIQEREEPFTLNYMVPWSMSNSRWRDKDSTQEIFNYFGLDSDYDAPCFVAFIWGDDNQLSSFIIKIDDRTENAAYKSLSDIVSSITDAEKHILEEYKQTENVFREVEMNLKGLKLKYEVKKIVKRIVPFVEFFSYFK